MEDNVSVNDVTVTPAAATFIRRMIRFGGAGEAAGFRLVVKPGGCSGLSSEFSVEGAPLEGDKVLDFNGLKLFLPVESRVLLTGVTIDFNDTRQATGLSFIDPKAGNCGCSSTNGSSSGAAKVQLGSLPK
jgi:iron-sulfur cluster assembly protein